MQETVAISLHRLGRGDELPSIGDLYGIHKSALLNNKGVLESC